MSPNVSHLSEAGKVINQKTSLTGAVTELFSFLRETQRKCIGNCSTANVLCKSKRKRGKGKIMELFEKLLEKLCERPSR